MDESRAASQNALRVAGEVLEPDQLITISVQTAARTSWKFPRALGWRWPA